MENDIPLKILAISTAATLGVLLRLALDNVFSGSNLMITSFTGILFAVLPSNFCGCFILGFHESLKRRFKYPDWLDLAIATGFTGSVTTFASWFLQVTSMLAFGPRFQAFLAILVGVGMAFFGFILGRDGADLLLHIFKKREQVDLSRQEDSAQPSESRGRKVFATVASFVVFAVIYGGMIYGSIRGNKDGSGNNWDFYFMCAVFAPFGALLRWLLSRFNSKIERFPLGTFAANMAAMVVNLSISTALFFSSTPSFSTVFILSAVVSGLGGSLSTVSTWVKEALQLPRSSRYVYVLGTVCAAVVLGVVIFAFPVWVS